MQYYQEGCRADCRVKGTPLSQSAESGRGHWEEWPLWHTWVGLGFDVSGLQLLPSLDVKAGVATRGQPLPPLSVIRPEGIWGNGMGLLTSWAQSPEQSEESSTRSLFSIPLFCSQLLRETCPKNNSQQPSHPRLLMFKL